MRESIVNLPEELKSFESVQDHLLEAQAIVDKLKELYSAMARHNFEADSYDIVEEKVAKYEEEVRIDEIRHRIRDLKDAF